MPKSSLVIGLAIALILVVLLSVQSCNLEPVIPSFDRSEKEIPVTVYFYDNLKQVTDKYRELHDIDADLEIATRKGFAIWPEWRNKDNEPIDPPEGSILDCEIHTVRPKSVNDDATLTLGHELLHCLYGSYHKQH